MPAERIQGSVDHGGGDQGARAVMDQHQVGRCLGEAFEAEPRRLLPRGTAGNRRQQLAGVPALARRVVVEGLVGRGDHHPHPIHARVRREAADAVAEHGPAA